LRFIWKNTFDPWAAPNFREAQYAFCACGTGMTDVSLPIFQVEVQRRRIQMIDAKAASNDGGVHNLRPTTG